MPVEGPADADRPGEKFSQLVVAFVAEFGTGLFDQLRAGKRRRAGSEQTEEELRRPILVAAVTFGSGACYPFSEAVVLRRSRVRPLRATGRVLPVRIRKRAAVSVRGDTERYLGP